jgi:putative transposase
MTAVCETFGVARSNMAERVKQRPSKARGRPPLADDGLVDEIKAIISEMPTCGYRRVRAILRRKARSESRPWPNAKRVYRVMKVHGLLLQRYTGAIDSRRHDGRVCRRALEPALVF